MHAGRGKKNSWMGFGERQSLRTLLDRGAGDDHFNHAGLPSAPDHFFDVVAERRVREIRPDVDQVHVYSAPCGSGSPRRIFRPLMVSFTVPQSGRLRRARSASCSTMFMSFSAHGMPLSSARWSMDQFWALP